MQAECPGFEFPCLHKLGIWLNLVEHRVWDARVACSNHAIPTNLTKYANAYITQKYMNDDTEQSVYLSCGVIHESVFRKVASMKYSRARKFLKGVFMTHCEQDEVIRTAKEFYQGEDWFRLEDPDTPESKWKCLDNTVF